MRSHVEHWGIIKSLAVVALLLASLVAADAAQAAWTNGQAATIVLGQTDFVTRDSGVAQNKQSLPMGVCVDKNTGKVFVLDNGNSRVLRFSSANAATNGSNAEAAFGQPSYTDQSYGTSQTTLRNPMGCAMTDSGDLWVADAENGRVLLFSNAANKPEFNAQADKVLGQADFNSRVSTATQANMSPEVRGVAVSPDGETLWASAQDQNRVLRWDNVSSKSNGANADSVLGQTDFTSTSSGATASTLHGPSTLALDASGNLYVLDATNNRVLRFDNAASLGAGASASGVLGASDLNSQGAGAATAAAFDQPAGIAIASDGRLYVASYSQSRVLIFTNPASKANGADADYVLGQTDFTSSSYGLSATQFSGPMGLGFNPLTGILYVADGWNARVLGFYNEELIRSTQVPAAPAVGYLGFGFALLGLAALALRAGRRRAR
jgi:sugar lactone lactonase YvrE